MAKKKEVPDAFPVEGEGYPCRYCKDWHEDHDGCPFRVLSDDAPEVREFLRSVEFVDRGTAGRERIHPHVTMGVKVNGHPDGPFQINGDYPISVEAGAKEATILSIVVRAADIVIDPDMRRARVGGLDVLAPIGLDDPSSAYCWESVDDEWTRVWLYVEHVAFTQRPVGS